MKKIIFIALFSFISSLTEAQSPNAQGATARMDAAALQARSEKGQSGGYPSLGTYVAPASGPQPIIDPRYLFADFDSATDNTIWVKSGSSLIPLGGVSVVGGNITVNNVFSGALTTNVYGVKISSGSYPLFLRGGSGNRVMVDYNQSIGGSNSTRDAFVWFINPSGGFSLSGGAFSGAIDLNSSAITEASTIAGSAMSQNFSTSTLSSSSGNITVSTTGSYGLVVPSTGSGTHTTFALNTTAADLMYGRKDSVNTWDSIQTFSASPVVPDSSFSIAKTASLQASLDACLKKNGSNTVTGNISMGNYKITNLGTPTTSTDAVTLGYLTSNYSSSAVTSVSIQAGTPMSASTVSGATTLSMTEAASGSSGFLSQSNFTRFDNAATAISSLGVSGAKLSSLLDSSTSQTDLATTATTSMYSYTMPAGILAAGDEIVVRASGNFILEGAQTIAITFVVGGTTAVTMSLPGSGFTPSSSEVPYQLEARMAIRAAGISGVAVYSVSILTPTKTILANAGSTTINTTISRTLSVTAAISAITGANHFSVESGTTRLN